jgi:hypothetical protein
MADASAELHLSAQQEQDLLCFGEVWARYDGTWDTVEAIDGFEERVGAAIAVMQSIMKQAVPDEVRQRRGYGDPEPLHTQTRSKVKGKPTVGRERVFSVRLPTPVRDEEIGGSAHFGGKQSIHMVLRLGQTPVSPPDSPGWATRGELEWSIVLPAVDRRPGSEGEVDAVLERLNEKLGGALPAGRAFRRSDVFGRHAIGLPFCDSFGPGDLRDAPATWARGIFAAAREGFGCVDGLLSSPHEEVLVEILKDAGMAKAASVSAPSPGPARSTPGGDGLLVHTVKELLTGGFPQVVLYGPPGTGKTYTAEAVARALGVEAESGRQKLVVFHPSYEYDQFIGGLSVSASSGSPVYEFAPGRLLELVEAAPDGPKVLIIDELNRGNLSKLLGELLYALEYRGRPVALSCRSEALKLPPDLYVIATMNTADRSIAMMDAAIRRRFAFVRVGPDEEVVRAWWKEAGDAAHGQRLAALMKALNHALPQEEDLADLKVGHSYFLGRADDAGLEGHRKAVEMRWTYQVKPLLADYSRMAELGAAAEYLKWDLERALAMGASEPGVPR